jgi:hypothetical protein
MPLDTTIGPQPTRRVLIDRQLPSMPGPRLSGLEFDDEQALPKWHDAVDGAADNSRHAGVIDEPQRNGYLEARVRMREPLP